MPNPTSKEFIELYRFLAAVCISLHKAAFEGVQREDVWPELNRLWQLAEDVGELWRNPEGKGPNSIADNLESIEEFLIELSVKHPGISFRDDCFEMSCGVFHIDRDADFPSIKSLGEYPNKNIWKGILSPAEYSNFLACLDKKGKWKKQLRPLIDIFSCARVKIVDYIPKDFLLRDEAI